MPQRPVAIYQIGQVSAPGISDLDFVIVFPNGTSIDWIQYQPKIFPEWIQQVMTHPPYCCTESLWPLLPAWFPVFNLSHLWGNTLPEPEVPEELTPGCSLGMLVDYLIVKIPRDLIWKAWERPLDVRILLCMLNSLKHTVQLAKQARLFIPKDNWPTLSEIDTLRTHWFDVDPLKRLEMLGELCTKACELAGELISQVDRTITQDLQEIKQRLEPENSDSNHPNIFRFIDNWNIKNTMNKAFKRYAYDGQIVWDSPLSFSQVLAIYANECPQFGKYLHAKGCHTELYWNGGVWNDGLRYHARAMSAYAKATSILGIPPQKYIALGYSEQAFLWKLAQPYAQLLLKPIRKILRKI